MKVLGYNSWNFDAEPGDIMITHNGKAFRLYTMKRGPKAAAGELSMREIKRKGMVAKIVDGKLVWESSQ